MASIGGITLDSLTLGGEGTANEGMQLEEVTRAGVDGKAYVQVGTRPDVSTYKSSHGYGSAAARKSGINAYRSLQGEVVSITEEDGTSWDAMVLHVKITAKKKAAVVAGFSGSWLLDAAWDVEAV